jgi:hypothetical protein
LYVRIRFFIVRDETHIHTTLFRTHYCFNNVLFGQVVGKEAYLSLQAHTKHNTATINKVWNAIKKYCKWAGKKEAIDSMVKPVDYKQSRDLPSLSIWYGII